MLASSPHRLAKSFAIVACVLILVAIVLAVDIAAVVIGVENTPEEPRTNMTLVCESDAVSFDLTVWLIVGGCETK